MGFEPDRRLPINQANVDLVAFHAIIHIVGCADLLAVNDSKRWLQERLVGWHYVRHGIKVGQHLELLGAGDGALATNEDGKPLGLGDPAILVSADGGVPHRWRPRWSDLRLTLFEGGLAELHSEIDCHGCGGRGDAGDGATVRRMRGVKLRFLFRETLSIE